MPTFTLSCKVTVSAYTEVQAASPEEAIKIARARTVELGGAGSGAYPAEFWVIEEADGEPNQIQLDED